MYVSTYVRNQIIFRYKYISADSNMKQTTRDYTKVLVQIQFIYSNQIFWYKMNIYIYIQNEHRYKSSEVYTYIYRKKVVKIDL